MLALPITNSWGFVYTNAENGSTAPGTSVAPGASDVEGAFVEIGPDASITAAIQFARICVFSGFVSAQAKNHLLDCAYDPTGGTTYDRFLFQNFVCGGSTPMANGGGADIIFPCNVPAGSAIAVRAQGSNATAGTIIVLGHFYGKPSRPEICRPGAYSETLGYSSGTLGTSFTPGTAAWGAWASIGTTTKKHFWAQLGVQLNNAAVTARGTRVQLGIGDGTNMHIITDTWAQTGSSEQMARSSSPACAWEIPSGAELWVRGNGNGAADTGWNATAVLFGG